MRKTLLVASIQLIVFVVAFAIAPSVPAFAAGAGASASKSYTITERQSYAISPSICAGIVHEHAELAPKLKSEGGCFTYSVLKITSTSNIPMQFRPASSINQAFCQNNPHPDGTYDYDAYGPVQTYDIHIHADLWINGCNVPRLDYEDCYVAGALWFVGLDLQQCTSWASTNHDNSEYLMAKYWVTGDGPVNYTEEQYIHILNYGYATFWGNPYS